MAHIYLAIAIVSEVIATTALKAHQAAAEHRGVDWLCYGVLLPRAVPADNADRRGLCHLVRRRDRTRHDLCRDRLPPNPRRLGSARYRANHRGRCGAEFTFQIDGQLTNRPWTLWRLLPYSRVWRIPTERL